MKKAWRDVRATQIRPSTGTHQQLRSPTPLRRVLQCSVEEKVSCGAAAQEIATYKTIGEQRWNSGDYADDREGNSKVLFIKSALGSRVDWDVIAHTPGAARGLVYVREVSSAYEGGGAART